MFRDDFYSVVSHHEANGSIRTQIQLNSRHAIYQGHFPGNPVTPGVMQLEIIKEVLQAVTGSTLIMTRLSRCKFLNILDPEKSKEAAVVIEYTIENNYYSINASIQAGAVIFIKLNAIYRPA